MLIFSPDCLATICHLLLLLLLLLRTFKGDLLLKIIFVEMMMERRLDVETFNRFPETLFNRFR